MLDPAKPTPRSTPVATGTIVLAASTMLTLAACVPNGGAPPVIHPAGTTSTATPPVAGGIAPPPSTWKPATQPASQPATIRSIDFQATPGIMLESRTQWSSPASPKTYTVKPGDTLTSIARDRKTTVDALKKANPAIANPDQIKAGQVINLP